MARYGKGGYNEWKENRVTSYDKKTEGAALGLKGWEGNKIIEHSAKQLAEQRGKPGADYGKGSIYWDMAETALIRKGRNGGDVHSGRFAQENEDDMNYMSERIDALENAEIPEEQAEPAPEIEEKQKPITYSSAVQDAKERTEAFLDGSKESFNFYTGAASTENNQVEDPDSELSVANNKATSMYQGQSDPMLQSRHEDRNLNFR